MYQKIALHPELMPYIKSISVQEANTPATTLDAYPVFPSSFPVIGFQYRGKLDVLHNHEQVTLSPSGISGLQTSLRRFQPQADTRTVLVQFYPHTVFAFLQHPLHELTNQQIGLANFLQPSAVDRLEDQLDEAASESHIGAVVQQFLLAQIQRAALMTTDVVTSATRQILSAHGHVRIERLARDYAISRRQLERQFQFYVGLTPKDFASLVRFDWSLANMRTYPTYTALALVAGYADQAHFIRQFTRYTGASPKNVAALPVE